MTRKDNPFLARATVNRLWSHLFGRGIIDPVDDIRSSNPPVNGPLLDALAKDFVDHDFDVRHILRTMLNSRTYQLSARTNRSSTPTTRRTSRTPSRGGCRRSSCSTRSAQITGVREKLPRPLPGAGQRVAARRRRARRPAARPRADDRAARPVRPAARRIDLRLRAATTRRA